MAWWRDLSAVLLLICPLVALLSGLAAGLASRNWGFGLLTGAMTILIPLLTLEVELQFLGYAPIYGLVGLLGSIMGWGAIKLYSRHRIPFS